MSTKAGAQGLFDPQIIGAAALDALRKLDPRALAKNPVIFVTEVVSVVVTGFFIRDLITHENSPLFSGQIAFWLWFTVLFANFAEAVAEGRGKAQAETLRKSRSDTQAKRYVDPKNLGANYQKRERARSARRRRRPRRGRRHHSRRRRHHRGPRLGQRIGDHRRIRARHSRGGRRPLGGDGRHHRAVRPDQGAHHCGRGLDVHRPHDRARRGRRAAEDAERTGAVDPAVRPDADLPDRLRDALAARRLFRNRAFGDGADRAAGLSDPDHDRRPALGDRHRRHGPPRSASTSSPPPAAPSRRRATSIRCCSTRRGRSLSATAWPTNSSRSRACRKRSWRRRSCWRASPTRRPRDARSSRSPGTATTSRRRDSSKGAIVPFSAQTRISGVDLPGRVLRKGAVDAILGAVGPDARNRARRIHSGGRSHRALRRHSAGGLRQQPIARRSST